MLKFKEFCNKKSGPGDLNWLSIKMAASVPLDIISAGFNFPNDGASYLKGNDIINRPSIFLAVVGRKCSAYFVCLRVTNSVL